MKKQENMHISHTQNSFSETLKQHSPVGIHQLLLQLVLWGADTVIPGLHSIYFAKKIILTVQHLGDGSSRPVTMNSLRFTELAPIECSIYRTLDVFGTQTPFPENMRSEKFPCVHTFAETEWANLESCSKSAPCFSFGPLLLLHAYPTKSEYQL